MIENPILRGFYPDASVCVVGNDYYIATSTFEWWPGIMIYHSNDLVNWELVSRPLCRLEQLSLLGNRNSGGMWAPHLSYSDGQFWLLITDVKTDQTFKDTLNYLMTCDKIDGEWSNPIFINAAGFDPALFHDDNGKKYILNMIWDYRPYYPNFHGVMLQEYDANNKCLIGEPKTIFLGTDWGLTEGPQLMKKDGWYYLLCAEGGTGYSHSSIVARSRFIEGPYEVSPYTPLISTKYAPKSTLQKCGHASFLRTPQGEWYITFICARPFNLQRDNCVLGRETGLAELEWVDEWPRLKNPELANAMPDELRKIGKNIKTVPPLYVEAPKKSKNIVQNINNSSFTDFDESVLPNYFHTLRGPLDKYLSLTERKGFLRLYGQQSIASLHNQSMVARRWQSWYFRAETIIEFWPKYYQELAGLTCFYNTQNYYYAYISWDDYECCRILDILKCQLGKTTVLLGENRIRIPKDVKRIHLGVIVSKEQLQFYYEYEGLQSKRVLLGEPLSTTLLSDESVSKGQLSFTGAMVGICVQDLFLHRAYADFDCFIYEEQVETTKNENLK